MSELTELLALIPRKRALPLPFRLEDEKSFGRPFPEDVRELLALAKAKKVPELGSMDPHKARHPIYAKGPDAAAKLLAFESKQIYPLYLTCHLTGLAPLAYTGVSVYERLVHVEHDGKKPSAVYEFSLFDDDIDARHVSIAAAFASAYAEDLEDDDEAVPKAIRALTKGKPAKRAPHEDPLALFGGSRWIAIALTGVDVDELEEMLEMAASFELFEQDVKHVPTRPSLALHWLAAHALLRNDEAFARTLDATAKSKSAMVASFRTLLGKWVAGGRKGALGPLSAKKVAAVLAVVDDAAPKDARAPKTKTKTTRSR